MRSVHNLKIEEIENYLNIIFNLREEIGQKDFKITMLEFELRMERQLLNSFKDNYFKLTVN